MKRLTLLILFQVSIITLSGQEFDSIIDARDEQVYKIVKVGNQWWMVENLSATVYSDGTPLVDGTGVGDIPGDFTTKYYFWWDDDSATYANTYGAYYTWAAAMNGSVSSNTNPSNVQGVCPSGWHLPSDSEWKELEMFLGMSQANADAWGYRGTDEGGKLKEAGTTYWWSPNTGADNSSGFTALSGGYRNYAGGLFSTLGTNAYFWSSTGSDTSKAWDRELSYEIATAGRLDQDKSYGFSVRCVLDSLQVFLVEQNTSSIRGQDGLIDMTVEGGVPPYSYVWSNGESTKDIINLNAGIYKVTVKDACNNSITDSIRIYDTFLDSRDDHRYKAIQIGEQIWMAENLNVGTYVESMNTGVAHSDVFDNQLIEKYCYDNDTNNCKIYGGLYEWNEMMDYSLIKSTQGVCPLGWHLPSDNEWKTLEISIGMSPTEADKNAARGTDEGTKLSVGGKLWI